MPPDVRGASGKGESPARCDECGTTLWVEPDRGAYPHPVVLPDSSAVDLFHPEEDGQRVGMTCSQECQRALEKRFMQRPFVRAELWACRLERALRARPEGLKPPELLEETGLTEAQMRAGFEWLDERRRRPSAE
ncbi:hypothetical protein ABZ464_51455 [Streptomyces sp. NPDC005820]|uniref:hypothetical protein n=1 Tax=Streptomyces sp. NPDC005820 TaxID=3157069 RepID=UPI0033FED3B5